MVVKKSSIEWFVHGRKLKNFHLFKTVTPEEIDMRLSDDNRAPSDFYTDPFHHQKLAFYIGTTQKNFLFFLDLGLGKTKIMLDIINYRKPKRTLVLVPNVSNIYGWIDEVNIHRPNLDVIGLIGSSEDKKRQLENPANLYVCNYAGLVALVTNKTDNKYLIDDELLSSLPEFDCLILDESTAVKNPRSLTYKICNKLALKAQFRYALTGTPFGRDPQDLWSQFSVIDRGETLGYTLSFFRSCFFSIHINKWGGREYTFRKSLDKDLHRLLANRSLFISERECQDLPARIEQQLSFDLPQTSKAFYNDVVTKMRDAGDDWSQMEGSFVKTRQISSGFLLLKDEDEKQHEIIFPDNPKLDLLIELVRGLPQSSKMVVFHEFLTSGKILSERLQLEGFGYGLINSKTKNKDALLAQFKNDNRMRVLCINNQSGAFGLNLQNANYCAFYESPISSIIRRQAEKRVHRTGQRKTVHYYDICGRGTVDQRILEFIRSGQDLFKAVVESKIDLRDWVKPL